MIHYQSLNYIKFTKHMNKIMKLLVVEYGFKITNLGTIENDNIDLKFGFMLTNVLVFSKFGKISLYVSYTDYSYKKLQSMILKIVHFFENHSFVLNAEKDFDDLCQELEK